MKRCCCIPVVLVLALLPVQAMSQTLQVEATPAVRIVYDLPFPGGMTICDSGNQPEVHLGSALVGTSRVERIVEHELVHVSQLQTFSGGCREGKKRYAADSQYRVAVEAEAECSVLARHSPDFGSRFEQERDSVALVLTKVEANRGNAGFDLDRTAALVAEACQRAHLHQELERGHKGLAVKAAPEGN